MSGFEQLRRLDALARRFRQLDAERERKVRREAAERAGKTHIYAVQGLRVESYAPPAEAADEEGAASATAPTRHHNFQIPQFQRPATARNTQESVR